MGDDGPMIEIGVAPTQNNDLALGVLLRSAPFTRTAAE